MHVLPNLLAVLANLRAVTWEAQTLLSGSSEGKVCPQIDNYANWFCDWVCHRVTPKRKTKQNENQTTEYGEKNPEIGEYAVSQRYIWLSLQKC